MIDGNNGMSWTRVTQKRKIVKNRVRGRQFLQWVNRNVNDDDKGVPVYEILYILYIQEYTSQYLKFSIYQKE